MYHPRPFDDALELEDSLLADLYDEDLADLADDFGLSEEDIDRIVFYDPRDDRFQIRAQRQRPSTKLFPYNTICYLERDAGTGFRRHCTGTLIAPQVVLTARHCLNGVTRMRVTPGADLDPRTVNERDRRPATPPSLVADSSRFRRHPSLDFGVIFLPEPFRTPREFMMLQPRGDIRTATLLTIAGYAGDRPEGTLWGHTGRIPLTGVTDTRLFYRLDTAPGHSGGPVWLLGNAGIRLLLAVHSGGPNDIPCRQRPATVGEANCGVRVTCEVIRTILGWCREFGIRTLPRVDRRVYDRTCGRT